MLTATTIDSGLTKKSVVRGFRLDAETDQALHGLVTRYGESSSVVIRSLIRAAAAGPDVLPGATGASKSNTAARGV